MAPSICIVIPCYNEAGRFNVEQFETFYHTSSVYFCLVNDGSIDATWIMLEQLKKGKERILLLNLSENVGKAETVRSGMMKALSLSQFDYIGFWDADFATPLEELNGFQQQLLPGRKVIAGSRIKRLGALVVRSPFRHYFGRIFATIVTKLFGLPIYDTQCGAKLFHSSVVKPLFTERFQSRWMFDLELFIRFKKQYGQEELLHHCYEYPLACWIEKGESKMKKTDFIVVPFQIMLLYWHYRTN